MKMMKQVSNRRVSGRTIWQTNLARVVLISSVLILALITAGGLADVAIGQSHAVRHRAKKGSICGNPMVACKTSVTFQPHDLPFRVPANSVIFDTELFYAVILKSVRAGDGDCDVFVPETDRLQTQTLFPERKVFTSRCAEPGELFYTNVSDKHRMMAVYAGTTLAEATRVLQAAKATRKFPGANIRQIRTGFNGT
jgi:hypothetical protein